MASSNPGVTAPGLSIRAQGPTVGPYSEITGLNPRFQPDHPRLRLRLDIRFEIQDAARKVQSLRNELLEVSPSLRRHRCQGDAPYRVTRKGDPSEGGDDFEADLALAHLIEHLMIDVVVYITDAPRISGATGAPVDPEQPFDLFVECPDRLTAGLATRMALGWISSLMNGQEIVDIADETLALARHLYRNLPHTVHLAGATRHLDGDPDRLQRALVWLEGCGIACPVPFTMNFSGSYHYRVCTDRTRAPAASDSDGRQRQVEVD